MLDRLEAAKEQHAGNRVRRMIKHPIKTVWPVLMRKTGSQRPATVPTFWGGKFSGVLPEAVSTQIWRRSYFDEPVCRTLIDVLEPGSTFVDIGSHMGFFSLLASELVGPTGRVLAIEAMPSTFQHLAANIRSNRAHDNVLLHQGAAFDSAKTLEFSDFGIVASSLNTAFSSRGQKGIITTVQKVGIEALPADEIIARHGLGRVDLIKIDAESSEKFVLRGLGRTLTTHRPVIVMEVGDISSDGGTPTAELIDVLSDIGYRAFEWHGRRLRPFASVGPLPYANLVFKPH